MPELLRRHHHAVGCDAGSSRRRLAPPTARRSRRSRIDVTRAPARLAHHLGRDGRDARRDDRRQPGEVGLREPLAGRQIGRVDAQRVLVARRILAPEPVCESAVGVPADREQLRSVIPRPTIATPTPSARRTRHPRPFGVRSRPLDSTSPAATSTRAVAYPDRATARRRQVMNAGREIEAHRKPALCARTSTAPTARRAELFLQEARGPGKRDVRASRSRRRSGRARRRRSSPRRRASPAARSTRSDGPARPVHGAAGRCRWTTRAPPPSCRARGRARRSRRIRKVTTEAEQSRERLTRHQRHPPPELAADCLTMTASLALVALHEADAALRQQDARREVRRERGRGRGHRAQARVDDLPCTTKRAAFGVQRQIVVRHRRRARAPS